VRRARVLAADPPWRFRDALPGPGRGAAKHYGTLSVPELCAFPLPPMLPDAACFLWFCASMAPESLEVLRAWNFRPVQLITWCKVTKDGRPRIGMGHYCRNASESCWLAVRGKLAGHIRDHSIPDYFHAERGAHSAKPDEFYRLAERLLPAPRVELFARRKRRGWRCYGDELDAAHP
jgi:N6-adenosine-specific RNA methylase IME4